MDNETTNNTGYWESIGATNETDEAVGNEGDTNKKRKEGEATGPDKGTSSEAEAESIEGLSGDGLEGATPATVDTEM